MRLTAFKRIAVAAAMVVAGVASAGQAQAFSFTNGDLVLAIYGNNTEALYNLGSASTILTPGGSGISNLDVSLGLSAAQVGTNPVKYTLFEYDFGSTGGRVMAGTAFSTAQITGPTDFTSQFNPALNMSTQLNFTGNTISKSNPNSFSSMLNTAGAGKFEGAWPVAMQGSLDQLLNIMQGDVDAGTFSQVGRALLTATGFLTVGNPGPSVAAVPLPAGVVLFGTGLIGLVGIARRSLNRMAAE